MIVYHYNIENTKSHIFPHNPKESVMCKVFPCRDLIMISIYLLLPWPVHVASTMLLMLFLHLARFLLYRFMNPIRYLNCGINSLSPGEFEWNFRYVIFKRILVIGGWGISCEIALIWMSLDFTDDQSTLVQVMPWCQQATSHYLSQCWPKSLLPYGVTRPQWVDT